MYSLIVPAHILWLGGLIYFGPSQVYGVAVVPLWILLGGLGLEIGYHRELCHQHFKLPSALQKILYSLGLLTLNGSPLFFRSLHIGYHHPMADTPSDFTSPRNGGAYNSHIGYLRKATSMVLLSVRQLRGERYFRLTHKFYLPLNYAVLLVIGLIDTTAAMTLLTVMILTYHQNAVVSTFCHSKSGYRNFETPDDSNNQKALSFLTFGLALHNNHHAAPSNPNFAVKRGEFDAGYFLATICGLTKIRAS